MSKTLKAFAVVGDGYGNTPDQLAVASTDGSQLAVFASAPPATEALKFKGEVALPIVIMTEDEHQTSGARYDLLQQRLTAADQEIDDLRAELKAVRLGPCKMIVGDELP